MTDLMPDIANDKRLDPRLKALLAAMPYAPPTNVASREEMLAEANEPDAVAAREMMTAMFDAMDSEEIAPSTGLDVSVHDVTSSPDGNTIKIRLIRPAGSETVPCVYYIHGGGMQTLSCFDGMYRAWGKTIASQGVAVAMVEFRNALTPSAVPEVAPFPAGRDDCVSGLKWLVESAGELGIDSEHIVIAGESGGGNLTLATGLKLLADGDIDLIRGLYALCPYIAGEWPQDRLPSSTENEGILISVHGNRGAMGYGIDGVRGTRPAGVAVVRQRGRRRRAPADIHLGERMRSVPRRGHRVLPPAAAGGGVGAVPPGDGDVTCRRHHGGRRSRRRQRDRSEHRPLLSRDLTNDADPRQPTGPARGQGITGQRWQTGSMSEATPLRAESDVELATRLATEAGHLLLSLREEMFAAGASTWDVKDAGDAVAQKFLSEEFAIHRPDDAVLSEEGKEDPRRFDAERVWIVDPLDGTREFSEQGRIDWAVHVALWSGDSFAAAAVALPAINRTLSTDPAPPMPVIDRERPILVTSRTRAPYAAVLVAEGLECDAVRLGSAGAKAMSVVLGEADIYVHDGGMYQWDSAAPQLSRWPPDSTPAASTVRPSSTTTPTRGCPTSSCAAPNSPTGFTERSGAERHVASTGELTAIRWEVSDRVATVWLHRPHRHNAWTGQMHIEFREVMADLEDRDDVRVVVVTGRHRRSVSAATRRR